MKEKSWSPYLAGGLTGIVFIISVMAAGKYFGASTTFSRLAGIIEKFFIADHVAKNDYFHRYAPIIDWQVMFVIGIFFGALISSVISKGFQPQSVPDMWKNRFGPSRVKRAIFAFIGGLIAIIGARLAGGCPSGHGLSGVMQMAVSGYISLICFFIGGLIMVYFLYRRGKNP